MHLKLSLSALLFERVNQIGDKPAEEGMIVSFDKWTRVRANQRQLCVSVDDDDDDDDLSIGPKKGMQQSSCCNTEECFIVTARLDHHHHNLPLHLTWRINATHSSIHPQERERCKSGNKQLRKEVVTLTACRISRSVDHHLSFSLTHRPANYGS